jgi:hypothetical protein
MSGVESRVSEIGTIVQLPRITDARGNLSFVEGRRHVGFPLRRAYWIYDVPGGEARGGHAHRTLAELLIALSGSFDVRMDDGARTEVVQLNRSYYGLLVPPMTWRRLENFSTNAVCLALASEAFDESGYVRDHAAYLAERRGGSGEP